MKKHLPFYILIAVILNFSLVAQSITNDISGIYEFRIDATNATIIDTLTLKSDGTFLFHEYDNHEKGIPTERNKYAKGNWEVENNIIYFFSEKGDVDDKYTLDFNNSKARFITKSPRDKSDRDIKTSLRFYESEIFWIDSRTFLKTE